jgi:Homoserine acetyltransferase
VGKDKSIDTNKYFVICANVIGGCMGSTGPKEIDPATGKPYGLNFPVITLKIWFQLKLICSIILE